MRIAPDLKTHITLAFAPLNNEAAVNAFPPPGSLSKVLNAAIPKGSKGLSATNTSLIIAKMFTTAAVNIWLRGVHSFLISASLTNVSQVWASVSGYYSSHYSVRALAHLLGFFHLFGGRRIVQLEFSGGRYVCSFNAKNAQDREHSVYWRIVKADPHFASDPFFTDNKPKSLLVGDADVAHRDRANYADHLPQFPIFQPLDAGTVKTRINRISEIECGAAPIPQADKYPDVESVQIVAYHRLVRFRDLVDTIIGGGNRFWKVHRDPPWARDFMDYQLTEADTLRSQFTL